MPALTQKAKWRLDESSEEEGSGDENVAGILAQRAARRHSVFVERDQRNGQNQVFLCYEQSLIMTAYHSLTLTMVVPIPESPKILISTNRQFVQWCHQIHPHPNHHLEVVPFQSPLPLLVKTTTTWMITQSQVPVISTAMMCMTPYLRLPVRPVRQRLGKKGSQQAKEEMVTLQVGENWTICIYRLQTLHSPFGSWPCPFFNVVSLFVRSCCVPLYV